MELETDKPAETMTDHQKEDLESDILESMKSINSEALTTLTNLKSGDELLDHLTMCLEEVDSSTTPSKADISCESESLVDESVNPVANLNIASESVPTPAIDSSKQKTPRPPTNIARITRPRITPTAEHKNVNQRTKAVPPHQTASSKSISHIERNRNILSSIKPVRGPPALTSASITSPPALPESDAISDIQIGKIEERLSELTDKVTSNDNFSQAIAKDLLSIKESIALIKGELNNALTLIGRLSRNLDQKNPESTLSDPKEADPASQIALGSINNDSLRGIAIAKVNERAQPTSSESNISQSSAAKVAMRFRARRRS